MIPFSDILESSAASVGIGVTTVEPIKLGAETIFDADAGDFGIGSKLYNVDSLIQIFPGGTDIWRTARSRIPRSSCFFAAFEIVLETENQSRPVRQSQAKI